MRNIKGRTEAHKCKQSENSQKKHRRSDETIRRWISAGKIYPAPTFDGYQYLIHPSAQKITNYENLNPSILLNKNCKLLKKD
ncbi:excisionase [Providencia stuartii]|nr:excisionase [Providencia stuartii]